MAACGHPGQDAALYATVEAVSSLCKQLGICIPVGKDSLSMKTVWDASGTSQEVVSPLSLIVSAFAPVHDVRLTLTPEMRCDADPLLFVDLSLGAQHLGGSTLAQINGATGVSAPDLTSASAIVGFITALRELADNGHVVAYHDRSDGGLATTLVEMAICTGCGLEISLDALGPDSVAALFCEELGVVIQPGAGQFDNVSRRLREVPELADHVHRIGTATEESRIIIRHGAQTLVDTTTDELHQHWSFTTHQMARLRDNPQCADEAQAQRKVSTATRLRADSTIDTTTLHPRSAAGQHRPRVAVVREQGVNSHVEMAAAFYDAGFDAVDVHMSDLHSGRVSLDEFQALAACGGFSYGDVLGGGGGWAGAIAHNERTAGAFETFFHRPDTLTLGVCNGCQMLARLAHLIPGAGEWPRFETNRSNRFEARLSLVEVLPTNSAFLRDLAGSVLPIPVSHGEGRAAFSVGALASLQGSGAVAMRYVDHAGEVAKQYPANPNGSPEGVTALTTSDGRVTIMMPHPERAFRTAQMSWHPDHWGHYSPWFKLFESARRSFD
jgi:phosphoribosylformylglycinamidine synthase